MCVVVLIFHNHTSAKNPDFCQKSVQNTEKSPQKTLFYIYTILFRFSTTPTVPPPPQVCQSGLTIRGNLLEKVDLRRKKRGECCVCRG